MKGTWNFVLGIIVALVISVLFLPIISLGAGFNLQNTIDASTVNGLLAATAIVFAFVSFEGRDIEPFRMKYLFLSILVLFLLVTCGIYFAVVMQTGHVTKLVLLVAMCNLYFNVLSFNAVTLGKRRLIAKAKETPPPPPPKA
jgi:hypothetical protein